MKNATFFTLITLVALAVAGICFAASGTLPQSTGKVPATIQNLKAIAPTASRSRCDTVTGTSAVQKNYSAAGNIAITGQAFHPTTGAAIVVKWSEDGKQVSAGSTYEATNDKGTTITTITAAAFSNRTSVFCIRRQ